MSDFGGLIREARERLGLSPHRVAELIGRASGTVKAWERGRLVPSDPFVVTSLAAVLGIDELDLFHAAGLNPPDHRAALTIEQELATIAPSRSTPPPAPASAAKNQPSNVITDEHPTAAVPEAEPMGPAAEAISDFFQKGADMISDASAPVVETLRRRRREKSRPAPRPFTTVQPTALSGSYMDDPDERWSYRLRAVWTAAGVGAVGILLMWAGSRALDALGDTWDALLAGL